MTIERVQHSGAYIISDLIGSDYTGYLFTRTYYGYTLRQTKQLFKLAIEGEGER